MKKKDEITIRSSAAEYLTFIAATGDNPEAVANLNLLLCFSPSFGLYTKFGKYPKNASC